MNEKRRSQRVDLLSSGWLLHNESKYSCRILNISRSGVLLGLKKSPHDFLIPGESCCLLLQQADNVIDYQRIEAQVVRLQSGTVVLEFTELKTDSYNLLDKLVLKELNFMNGGQKLINLGKEVAERNGMSLTVLSFDNGQLNPEREMHTLRLSSGEHSINVHLHSDEIEAFNGQNNSERTESKIHSAIERLTAMS